MPTSIILKLLILAGAIFVPFLVSADDDHDHGRISDTKPAGDFMVEFSDAGISPAVLETKVGQGIVFFVNSSRDSLATLEMKLASEDNHCASSSFHFENGSQLRSTQPIGPGDFGTVCIHKPGKYEYTVYGLGDGLTPRKGTIVVIK